MRKVLHLLSEFFLGCHQANVAGIIPIESLCKGSMEQIVIKGIFNFSAKLDPCRCK